MLPLLSLLVGWSGLDRLYIGDWRGAGRKVAVLIALFWSVNTLPEGHPAIVLVMTLFAAGWVSDVVWTRREYRERNNIPTDPPTWGKALVLALFLGISGIDRFYIGDRILGTAKVGIWVAASYGTFGESVLGVSNMDVPLLTLYACDLVLSPLRAGKL